MRKSFRYPAPLLRRLTLLFIVFIFGTIASKAVAADEDTCKTIKLGDPQGPGNFTEEVCVPEDKCVPSYDEKAHCSKSQSVCNGHCENLLSACYAEPNIANKGVKSTVKAGGACKLFIGTGGQKKKIDGVLCTFTTTIAAGGSLGCHCECDQHIPVPITVSFAPLPEGAIYATANVEPDTTIEIQQPGYAVIATAEVVSTKRVNPGDHLDAKTLASVAFDNGTGIVIETLKRSSVSLDAVVGSTSLVARDHPQPLPVQNGSATLYVASDRPFVTPAITINNADKLPDTTQAVFLNSRGERVGTLSTFNGLQGKPDSNITIRTLDRTGAPLQQGKVEGGVLDCSPKASFDKPTYKAGERGRLLIQNHENYQKGIEMTRFGGSAKLTGEPIRLIPLSDVKGLPPEAPFHTTSLNFQALHAGEARVAVILPRILPPKPVENPGNDEGLKQADSIFQSWLRQVGE